MTIRFLPLPLALAATLSLAACGGTADTGDAVAATVDSNDTIAVGEGGGDANAHDVLGDADILTPVDGPVTDDVAGNAATPVDAF